LECQDLVDGVSNDSELMDDQLRVIGSINDPTSLRILLSLFNLRLRILWLGREPLYLIFEGIGHGRSGIALIRAEQFIHLVDGSDE